MHACLLLCRSLPLLLLLLLLFNFPGVYTAQVLHLLHSLVFALCAACTFLPQSVRHPHYIVWHAGP
jgi:hypothetical protein